MTPDEISREVRARVEWGHPANRIRSELLRAGADVVTLDEVLRTHLRASNAEYRWKGLLGLLAAAALLWGSYQVGSPLLRKQAEAAPDVSTKVYWGRGIPGEGRATLALGLLVVGAASLGIGAHRLLWGRRGDTQ